MVLSDLMPDVLGRIEENLPTAQPPAIPGPVFWNLTGEVYPQMVDAMFEAALVTATVQFYSVQVSLAANTTYFTIPKGAIAPIRMKAPYTIRKVSLDGLDMMMPNWQQLAAGTQIQGWFPLGTTGFGIYPQLTADAKVVMDFIASPTNKIRPYNGTESVPFQTEFTDLIAQYAAALLRSKEGGAEAEESNVVYEQYLQAMKNLSAFQSRINELDFSAAFGGNVSTGQRRLV